MGYWSFLMYYICDLNKRISKDLVTFMFEHLSQNSCSPIVQGERGLAGKGTPGSKGEKVGVITSFSLVVFILCYHFSFNPSGYRESVACASSQSWAANLTSNSRSKQRVTPALQALQVRLDLQVLELQANRWDSAWFGLALLLCVIPIRIYNRRITSYCLLSSVRLSN